MTWQNTRILVTGAGGFIGNHLVERLLGEGARVRAFVRYNGRGDVGHLGHLTREPCPEIVAGDLRDSHAVSEAVRGVDAEFHLGALTAIPYSYIHRREVVETNVTETLNVLMAAREHKPARVVHIPTSEVYGTARRVPIDEEHPLQGQSPYSASKIGADKIVESFHLSFGLPVVMQCPFNTFGPRQSARAVIPTIITQALTRDVVELGDLTPTRDLTYITDTVDGFVRAATAEGVMGQTINLGHRDEISIGDLAQRIIRITRRPVKLASAPERFRPPTSKVRRLYADNRKAKVMLDWSPRVSLDDGLRATVAWMADHLDHYRPNKYAL
jgi:NAD dependent epimerase/dehydratase